MNIDNQKEYWDEVAETKTFTHPINLELLNTFFNKQSIIVDFGCGYGRIVKQLNDLGFENICGFDTSKELIARGVSINNLNLYHISDPTEIKLEDNSIDCILPANFIARAGIGLSANQASTSSSQTVAIPKKRRNKNCGKALLK